MTKTRTPSVSSVSSNRINVSIFSLGCKNKHDCSIESAVAVLLLAVLWYSLLRAVLRPMMRAVEFAGCIARDDLDADIEVESRDEVGRLLRSLRNMRDSLRNSAEKERRALAAAGLAAP